MVSQPTTPYTDLTLGLCDLNPGEVLGKTEREQRALGNDVHDDLGQQLAGIWCLSQAHESNLLAQEHPEQEEVSRITGLLKDAVAVTHTLARRLSPGAAHLGGMPAALSDLAQRTAATFKIACHWHCPSVVALDDVRATQLFRIAQEAVTNAVQHGHAKEIEVDLSFDRKHIILSVIDNGTGISESSAKKGGVGVRMMMYRAGMLGGVLHIANARSHPGTMVTCKIPTSSPAP
ncbi:MAG: ATP-binding protein [Prosthecobacter sp.]|nr:ATP-binding protein [Prosthecobacter sp.]